MRGGSHTLDENEFGEHEKTIPAFGRPIRKPLRSATTADLWPCQPQV